MFSTSPLLTGNFTLAYEGETTVSIAYNEGASELTDALRNLSTLSGSNVTAETYNCSVPEETCAWRITFVGVYGDAELLVSDADGLGGNAAAVSVVEEVLGEDASDIVGSPLTVSGLRPLSPRSRLCSQTRYTSGTSSTAWKIEVRKICKCPVVIGILIFREKVVGAGCT